MTTAFTEHLNAVDPTILTPLVRQALADDEAAVLDWHFQPVSGGMAQARGGSHGVYRFGGLAHSQGVLRSWSIILKATAAAVAGADIVAGADPSDPVYWKREVLIYQSGFLTSLPKTSLVAPHCYGVMEYPDQEFWLWLEDVADCAWSLDEYGLTARHLGRFNGAYLNGHPLPQAAWLSTGQVGRWLAWGQAGIEDIQRLSQHPLHRRWLDDDGVAHILRLWAARERLLAALDRLPRTFCHHDAYGRNLMVRRNGSDEVEIVAIDWALAGIGRIGEELSTLVGTSVTFYDIDLESIREFEAVVFAGYMTGLRESGWQGPPELVRFGYAATTALSYGVGLAGLVLSLLTIEEEVEFFERFFGRPTDELLSGRAIFQRYFYELGDEALTLLDVLAAAGKP